MNKPAMIIVSTTVVLIALLGGIGIGAVYARPYYDRHQEDAAAKVAATFVKDITGGKAADSYALTDANLQKRESKEIFTKLAGGLTGAKATYEAAQTQRQGDTVDYTQVVSNLTQFNAALKFHVVLVNEKGAWKVDSFSVN